MKMKKNKSASSYEKIFDNLEIIVQKMDSGDITLEKSLELFEKVMSLIQEGKDLPEWHHLITGSIEKMVRKNICIRNKVTNEKKIRKNDITNYIYDWE